MSFQVDRAARRIFDPARGLELRTTGGGSGGMVMFELVKDDQKIKFTAFAHFKPNPDFDHTDLATKDILIWEVSVAYYDLPGMSVEDVRQAICESLEAFKSSYGNPIHSVTEVLLPALAGHAQC